MRMDALINTTCERCSMAVTLSASNSASGNLCGECREILGDKPDYHCTVCYYCGDNWSYAANICFQCFYETESYNKLEV